MSQIDLGGMTSAPLSEEQVAAGLKQALQVGSDRATSVLSKAGGFSDDPLLRLGLPDELEPLASTLRNMGMGSTIDALELKMNEAAEAAVGEAAPVFGSAIASMTVQDAFAILKGNDDAATRYFEAHTSDELRTRFSPVVKNAMSQVGVYRSLENVFAAYETLPFSKPAAPDMASYISDGALAGLFQTLAKEEKKIRDDPAARSTALLRRVFGSAAARPSS